jgi:hypothetical protein
MLNDHRDHISPTNWGSSNITLHHDLAPYTPAEATQKEEMLSIFYSISAEITLETPSLSNLAPVDNAFFYG